MTNGFLAILLDTDDLATVEACAPAALGGAVLAFDPGLHLHLEEREVAHFTPWDLVGAADQAEMRAFERSVRDFWDCHAHVIYDGVDLLEVARIRHAVCFNRVAWAAYVVGKALRACPAAEVVVADTPGGHGLEQPPGHRKMPLLPAVVRGMAEQAGRQVRLVRPARRGTALEFVDHAALAGRRTLPPVAPKTLLAGRPYVLLPGSGADLLRQLPLVRGLLAQTDLAVVQIYKSAGDDTLRQMSEAGHLVWHESQVTADVALLEDLEEARAGRACFDRACATAPNHLRGVFANPHMDMHFEFIFGEYARRMAWHVKAWRRFLADVPPRLVVANYPVPIYEIAQRSGVPCLALAHDLMMRGYQEWYRCLPPSYLGAISEPHRRKLIDAGINERRIIVTGDPGLDVHLRAAAEALGQGPADGPGAGGRRGHAPLARRHILLPTVDLGSLAVASTADRVDWLDAIGCLGQLADMAERHPEWRLIVKCHPRYDHPDLYERINRRLPPDRRLAVVTDTPLQSLMPVVDAVVFPNVKTSALIEASLWNKPVLILSQSMVWVDLSNWLMDRWPQAGSVAALEAELTDMFADEREYQRRVAQTRTALRAFLGGEARPSVPRCVEVVETLASLGRTDNAPGATADSGLSPSGAGCVSHLDDVG